MFRVKRATEHPAVLWATILLLVAMVAASGTVVWLVAEIRKEQRAILEIVKGGVVEDIERIGTLPGEFRLQLVFTVLILLVLIVSAIGLIYVVQAYLKSLTSLRKVKILAWDILTSMDQGVVTTDHGGKITSVNPRAQELLEIAFDCVGRQLEEICQNAQQLFSVNRVVIETGKSQNNYNFSVIRNGHPMQLRAECHVLQGTDGMGTILYIRDVTEHALIEDRMRRMERFMRLGTLAAGLHHEIKNPLSALSLHVQLLEERLEGQADNETAENLGVLKTEITRIVGVLESFRDYASMERLNHTQTDISALVRQTVELIRPEVQQQGVQLVVSIPDSGVPSISADATRLEQVFLNLVLNALDEMRNGGILSLTVVAKEERIAIEVSDTGLGIPDNIRSSIYDPYFTTKNEGSGMGLAICDKIVRQHGGQIDVDTGPSGSTFRISLPVEHH